MATALLVLTCTLILADAYLTWRGLALSARELHPIRALLIRLFGKAVGTYGASVALCCVLVYGYFTTTAVQTQIFSFGSLAVLYAGVVVWNYLQLRKLLSRGRSL